MTDTDDTLPPDSIQPIPLHDEMVISFVNYELKVSLL